MGNKKNSQLHILKISMSSLQIKLLLAKHPPSAGFLSPSGWSGAFGTTYRAPSAVVKEKKKLGESDFYIIIMVLFYLFIQYYAVLKEISIR